MAAGGRRKIFDVTANHSRPCWSVGRMTRWHARGFLFLGWLLWCAPAWWPGYFPAGPIDGLNTSALWLQAMGLLNAAIGASGVLRLDLAPMLTRTITAWSGGSDDLGPELFRAPYRSLTEWLDYEALLSATTPEPVIVRA